MTIQHVIAQYSTPAKVTRVESLGGHGGFSGATLWRLTTDSGELCLRRWPQQHPSREHLLWIHGVLRSVRNLGLRIVPNYYQTSAGQTIVTNDGQLWELSDWLPGKAANSLDVTQQQLEAGMQALAQFHLATAKTNQQPTTGRSPAITWRWERFQQLTGDGIDRLAAASAGNATLPSDTVNELITGFRELAPRAEETLARAATLDTPLQPCLRDIWYEHVLFAPENEGHRVTGLVDFGAMRIESVAIDVARLLGSYTGGDQARWSPGQSAYEAIRPLSEAERQLAVAVDLANGLMAGLQWIEWIYVDGRQFADIPGVTRRLEATRDRLAALAGEFA